MTKDPTRPPSNDLAIVQAYSGTARENVGYLLLAAMATIVGSIGVLSVVA